MLHYDCNHSENNDIKVHHITFMNAYTHRYLILHIKKKTLYVKKSTRTDFPSVNSNYRVIEIHFHDLQSHSSIQVHFSRSQIQPIETRQTSFESYIYMQ